MLNLLERIKFILKNKYPKIYNFLIKIKNKFTPCYTKSYSQCGEDVALNSFININKKRKGFFVDIGAYHPKKYSNTYLFYKIGWSGINIDAKPGSMKLFKKIRKRDINLELAVNNNYQENNFYIYKGSARNTFDINLVKNLNNKNIAPEKKITLKTYKLEYVFDKFLPPKTIIDFLSIDVEGLDLEVLRSNNWEKYKPKYILVEDHSFNINNLTNCEIFKFLSNLNYKLILVTKLTLIFIYEK